MVALVTGSRRGIGFGILEHLARAGFSLVMNDIVEKKEAQENISKLEKMGAEVLYCQADISQKAARTAMLEQIKEKFGKINILVNNAGVAPSVRADLLEASEESFERLIRINLQGPYFLTQAVANMMIKSKAEFKDEFFCIINISSVSAQAPSPPRGEYCISKAGVSMATKLYAIRLAEIGIPVYEIQPGIIMTDMTSVVKEKYDKMIFEGDLVPQKRWGFPEDIGKAVAALANGSLPYSTGQIIYIDGALMIPHF